MESHRKRNLKFILPYILKTGCKVLVAEQSKNTLSDLSDVVPIHENVKHLLYVSNSEQFHKTGIINWATKNHVNTKYAWVNDTDFYMKFAGVLESDWNADFIKPYTCVKKLSIQDTNTILSGKKLDVSYEDESAQYISLYGALSFIFEKDAFLNIGGMDETIFGWGKEDIELSGRVKRLNIDTQELDFNGIYLWHPIKNTGLLLDNTHGLRGEKDMAIVACHFNWCDFTNPKRNLHRFIRQMQIDEIPLYGIELSLTDEFETTGISGWEQLRVGEENVWFQKEACINLAVKKLVPEEYKKIAWIDCDLQFTNKHWYQETVKKLDDYKVVQLYTYGIDTDRCGRLTKKIPGSVFSYKTKQKLDEKNLTHGSNWFGYTGGAWAARREMWSHGGLYPYEVLGGGDTIFCSAVLTPELKLQVNIPNGEYDIWKTQITAYVEKSVSYMGGDFIHEWHGERVNRRYWDRYSLLKNINLSNVALDENGIVRNPVDNTVKYEVLDYFKNRNEDGDIKHAQKINSKTVVYTCIVGKYDQLKEVASVESGISYICFSDQPIQSNTWTIKPIPEFLRWLDNVKMARCMKILPHLFLEEYETSIWVDGSIEVLGNLHEFLKKSLKNYFVVSKHPDRDCIYAEGGAIVLLGKDDKEIIETQTNRYKSIGYPKNNGLVMTGIIARKHNNKKCIELSKIWWEEVREYSKRDQMSFNYAVQKSSAYIDSMNPRIFVSEHFQIWSHVHKGNTKVKLRKDYGEMKNYICGREV
jgi:hypothetical protein